MACQATANGFKCEKGPVTISSPFDVNNPLISHNWTIDGIQESTAASFTKNYASAGIHTVLHTGGNACGGQCSQSTQLEIVDTITQPPSTAAPASAVSPVLAGAVVVALGFLGIMMLKK